MSSSDSDSGPEDRKPSKKTAGKSDSKGSSRAKKDKVDKKDDNGEFWIDLGKKKWVGISEFKGMVMINIRERYEDKSTGELKPGKGISLQKEQWSRLKKAIEEVDEELETR